MEPQTNHNLATADMFKVMFDYFKHLTALSTGSVLLLVTLIEKLFKEPLWKPLVVAAYVGFTSSILAALIAMFVVASFLGRPGNRSESPLNVFAVAASVSLVAYFIGIGCLVIFAIKNWY